MKNDCLRSKSVNKMTTASGDRNHRGTDCQPHLRNEVSFEMLC
jgi:hypothetical protein